MSQHDLNIANATFPTTRSDINNALVALGSLQSGGTAPAAAVAGSLWYDSTTGLVKIRDAAGAAWISLWAVPTTTNEFKLPAGTLRVESTAPVVGIKDTDAGTNEKAWQFAASGTSLSLTTRTDADASGNTALAVSRTGTTVDGVQLGGTGVWGAVGYFVAAGSGNAFTGTLSPAPAAYQTGLMVQFYANHTITGAATLNLNGLGTKSIKDKKGNALTSGKITNGDAVVAFYNGTEFRAVSISNADDWIESAETAFTAGGAEYTFAHGLGAMPKDARVYLRCKTAEYGYAVGDEVPLYGHGINYNNGIYLVQNTTNIVLVTGSETTSPSCLIILQRGTSIGVTQRATPANWKLVVKYK